MYLPTHLHLSVCVSICPQTSEMTCCSGACARVETSSATWASTPAPWHDSIYIYIYIYAHPPPHDRPMWGRGRVMSVPMHDLPTDGRQSPLPNSIPKFPNFQHSPQPFFPKFPKCLSFPPNVKDRLCQMGHRFLDFFLEILEPCVFCIFCHYWNFWNVCNFGNLYTFMQRS